MKTMKFMESIPKNSKIKFFEVPEGTTIRMLIPDFFPVHHIPTGHNFIPCSDDCLICRIERASEFIGTYGV